ncbi:hypothetical protein Goshw_020767 [Gossypium schwendimanii]|uniref:Uncharacterized protein n=1 Tax=Gossypium schwendimanii TaxID=34291 RepID=A0A7J9N6B8_GOSSC|nr:hypothetical protein [Gossypium schwendimanii]
MSLDSTMDKVNELFNSHRDKLSEKNDALEVMMMALKEETMATTRTLSTRIEELEGELGLYRAAMGKGVANVAFSNEDVPKPKEFVGTRIFRGRSSGKVARYIATGYSVGVYSRVQGTHALSFRCDRGRSIACFSEWIEAVGQTEGGTKKCPKAVGSYDGS